MIYVFIFIIVISVTSVMLSGVGAVFQEQLGIPYQVGILSTLVPCYLVVLHGLKGLFAINAYIVPLIILFSLFVFISVFDGWGGFLGGLGLFLILLLSHLSLSVHPETYLFEIPMAEIVKQFGRMIHILFLLVIYGEIFNTVVANVYGIARQLRVSFQMKYKHAVMTLLFIVFFISQFEYGQLLTVLYPLFGYLGLFFLGVLLMKRMPDH